MPENIVVFQNTNKIWFLNTKDSWSEILIQQNSKHIFSSKKLAGGINETLLGGKDLFQSVAVGSP